MRIVIGDPEHMVCLAEGIDSYNTRKRNHDDAIQYELDENSLIPHVKLESSRKAFSAIKAYFGLQRFVLNGREAWIFA